MATYYVSELHGNDSNDGLSELTAWQTSGKIASGSFSAGDVILLESGGIYAPFAFPSSGNTSNPITISSYGTGEKPLIFAGAKIETWTNEGNGIYSYANNGFQNEVNVLVFDGELKAKGRSTVSDVFYPITAGDPDDEWVETSDALPAFSTGMQIVLRKERFIYHVFNVTDITNGDRVEYSGGLTQYIPLPGYGFFLQNSLSFLTGLGDWSYDTNNERIYVYFGGESPSNHEVEVSLEQHGISLINRSYVTIKNLAIHATNNHGIRLDNVTHININNCNFRYIGNDGIVQEGFASHYITVSSSLFEDVLCNGIFTNYTCSNMLAENNRLNNIYMIIGGAGQYGNSDNRGFGIGLLLGENNTVRRNHLTNIGFNGIVCDGNNFLVEENYINNVCLTKDDGGGIYCSLGGTSYQLSIPGSIRRNIVLNAKGYWQGSPEIHKGLALGIYMDDTQNLVTIEKNLCAYASDSGVHLHNCISIIVRNNILFGNRRGIGFIQDFGHVIEDCIVTDNIIYTNGGLNQTLMEAFYTSGTVDFGVIDNNTYRYVKDLIDLFRATAPPPLPWTFAINFEEWKQFIGGDANSTLEPYQNYLPDNYQETLLFSNDFPDENSVTLWPVGGFNWMDGLDREWNPSGYVTLTKEVPGKKSVFFGIGTLDLTQKYLIKLRVRGVVQKFSMQIELPNFSYGPFSLISSKQIYTHDEFTDYEFVLRGYEIYEGANINQLIWLVEEDFETIDIDSISLSEVEFDFKPNTAVIYNEEARPKTFYFGQNYKRNVETDQIGNRFILQPFEFAVLQDSKVINAFDDLFIAKEVRTAVSTYLQEPSAEQEFALWEKPFKWLEAYYARRNAAHIYFTGFLYQGNSNKTFTISLQIDSTNYLPIAMNLGDDFVSGYLEAQIKIAVKNPSTVAVSTSINWADVAHTGMSKSYRRAQDLAIGFSNAFPIVPVAKFNSAAGTPQWTQEQTMIYVY
ncbi:right-handed parallel beta-helix repeat-containing protein [Algoriphagus sp. Y33]|uniref:right-handed parallel beta-helix repeat-containing protein n=1 Tax=Algoriphagus sp. Y33 TaxID=2772483 RepID=UPI001782412C|nr:right-handed parallel beta-helix repeat-containing protein [Algoriphagus sp. Y33]